MHHESPASKHREAIEIRQQPRSFKDRADIKLWLKELGPVVQTYADVLEVELLKG